MLLLPLEVATDIIVVIIIVVVVDTCVYRAEQGG